MNKDVAEVQSTYRGDIINLSDPEALFSTILTGSIEDDCFGTFLSILQHLVAIPSAGTNLNNRNVSAMCLAAGWSINRIACILFLFPDPECIFYCVQPK